MKKISMYMRYIIPYYLFVSPSAIWNVFQPSFSRTEVYIKPHSFTAFFLVTLQRTEEVHFFNPVGINY